MNREQLGILVVAAIATVSLGLATPAFASIVDTPSENIGSGAAVFSEDVTLEDSLNPESRDLSGSPFLKMLYDTENPDNESTNMSTDIEEPAGRISLVPIAMVFLAITAAGIVGGVVWFWRLRRLTGSQTGSVEHFHSGDEDMPDPSPENLDRLTIDDLTNDVYRAWYELFSHIEPSGSESFTPRELAVIAVEEGLDRDCIEELTEQFETVRYGPEDVSSEHERRAREALSRLEIEEKLS